MAGAAAPRRRRMGRLVLGSVGLLGACLASCAPASGQTLRGRALDAGDERPLTGVLVELVDSAGGRHGFTLSDSTGAFTLTAPAPGLYRVEAERIGYRDYRSAVLRLARAGATYRADLLLAAEPVPIAGLEVTAERREAIRREVRLAVGVDPRSLRHELILRPAIESHLARGHDITDLLRWANLPGLTVIPTSDGACYQVRRRACLPVYLNGWRVAANAVSMIPLEVADVLAIVLPGESIQYPSGGVMIYTAGWIR